jgi:hypothetical protein
MERRISGGVILFLMSLGIFSVAEVLADLLAPGTSISRISEFTFATVYALLSAVAGRKLPGWCQEKTKTTC